MNNKVLLAVAAILITIGIVGAYVYKSYVPPTAETPTQTSTPTVTTTPEPGTEEQSKVETSVIQYSYADTKGKIIFRNPAGATFKSFNTGKDIDRVMAYNNGNDLLQLGINWVGYTGGDLELVKVVPVQNKYIGNLYRATGGGIADGSYVLASNTKTSGKCTGNGAEILAPCATNDQLYAKDKTTYILAVCMDLDQVAFCDQLMSGLELTK